MRDAGRSLRTLREKLGITMKAVESLSLRISRRHHTEEFAIPPSRLSDIETKGVVPSPFRLYSLSVIYGLPLLDLMSWYGIPPSSAKTERSGFGIGPDLRLVSGASPGSGLRDLREEVAGMTSREVEAASRRIAADHFNEEFRIPPSRLADIETKGIIPSIFRLYSLSVIYQVDIRELLRFYGVDSTLVGIERGDLGLSPPDFEVSFAPDLTPQQVRLTLQALADYYRACGGIGFQIDFEREELLVPEPAHV